MSQLKKVIVDKKKKKYKPKNNQTHFLNNVDSSFISEVKKNEQAEDEDQTIAVLNNILDPLLDRDLNSQKDYKKINEETHAQSEYFKNFKRHLMSTIDSATHIQIFYSIKKPYMVFQYTNKEFLRQIQLSMLLKANKDLGRNERKAIQRLFDCLYNRVGEKHCNMIKIAEVLADKMKVELNISMNVKNPLFYYEFDNDLFNFALFDEHMRLFQFTSKDIIEKKVEQKLVMFWLKFKSQNQSERKKKKENETQQYQSYFDNQEIDSENEGNYHEREEKIDISKLKKRLRELIEVDLSEFEDQIKRLEGECRLLQKKNNISDRNNLQYIKGKINELQQNLQNFKETATNIKNEYKQNTKMKPKKLQNMVKRMIIAQKQLTSRLPILARKNQIFQQLKHKNLLIIEGETGSGKSTQLPQILCQYYKIFQNPKAKPVLITQPRKLATRTVSERVAFEMQEEIGGFVDYSTSNYKSVSSNAKIIFKLDAVVLHELTQDRLLSNYCCLIIDEAHQRTISIDVILGLIMQLLKKRKDFKVIVTSASLDAKLFQEYFSTPVMKVSGRLFLVDIIYQPLNHQHDNIRKIQTILKKHILVGSSDIKDQFRGDVLVFCTGVEDITVLSNIFEKYLNSRVFRVFPLHGRLSSQDQKDVFLKIKQHKIIFATRIAETSITINGVKVVVDIGLDREMIYDQQCRTSSRRLMNISQSSAIQRAGRAGRTSNGYCFRLYNQACYNGMRSNKIAEIDNMALDTLVLRLKSLKVHQIHDFAYIKKPNKQALLHSVQTLKMIGGLNQKQVITAIGWLLLQLNVQPFLGRSIVQSIICRQIFFDKTFVEQSLFDWSQKQLKNGGEIVDIVVEILCMVINSGNLFLSDTLQNRERLYQIKFNKFSDERGDFFYLQHIFNDFMNKQHLTNYQKNKWLRDNFLNKKTLFETKDMVEEIKKTIQQFKLDMKDLTIKKEVNKIKNKIKNCKQTDQVVLACMLTSFSVNLCLYSSNPSVGYTLVLQKRPIQIYGTSTLNILSLNPKWIVCYDLKTNEKGIVFCTIAHEINFQFLKMSIDPYLADKLKLSQIQTMNPFYQNIERELPTFILQSLYNEYLNQDNSYIMFYRHVSLSVNVNNNTISIFYSKQITLEDIAPNYYAQLQADKNNQNNSEQQSTLRLSDSQIEVDCEVKNYINRYIDNKHNFIREINKYPFSFQQTEIYLQNGFNISNIYHKEVQYQFIVKGPISMLQQLHKHFSQYHLHFKGHILKINVFRISDCESISSQLTDLEYYGVTYQINEVKQSINRKLDAKALMYFYRGSHGKWSKMHMYFGWIHPNQIQNNYYILKQLQEEHIEENSKKFKYFAILRDCKFKITSKGTGINCQNISADAFELKQTIQFLLCNGILPFDFVMPLDIKEFREKNNQFSQMNQDQWEELIITTFEEYQISNLQVKVEMPRKRGRMKQDEGDELIAEISSSKMSDLQKMIKKIDGRESIIGGGKVHFRFNFKQEIIKIRSQVFKSLLQDFNYQKQLLEGNCQDLRIIAKQKIIGKDHWILISCQSSRRQNMLTSVETIRQLFTPFLIRLEAQQINYLHYSKQGRIALENIQEKFRYRICFQIEMKKYIIKVYCHQQDFKLVQTDVLNIFKVNECFSKYVGYRGKGLHKVTKAIQKIQDRLFAQKQKNNIKAEKKRYLQYRICFMKKQIQLYGDGQSLLEAEYEIQKLGQQQSGSCELCNKNAERPFLLINCSHSFCWKCLVDFIKQDGTNSDNVKTFICPKQGCEVLLNPYDIKTLLEIDQFQELLLEKLNYFVAQNDQYFMCKTIDCGQIFQKATVCKNKSFDCAKCGKWFCSKCLEPHQNFNCKQWQTKLKRGQLLKFGYKLCQCGYMLQKQQKGKMIRCKKCRDYLCWFCDESWSQQDDCYDHVEKCKA